MIRVNSANPARYTQYDSRDLSAEGGCEIRPAANCQTRQPCRPPSKLPIPPEGPPQFCILHFDLCIFRYKCRISSTNRPLFCTNEPNFQNSTNRRNPSSHKGLRQISSISHHQKRTQTNPNKPEANPNEPNLPKTQKPTQPLFSQRVIEMEAPSHSQKRTQTNPIFVPLLTLIVYNCLQTPRIC